MHEFHIHIDAQWVSESFKTFLLREQRFLPKNFSGFPVNSPRHAPDLHLTYKVAEANTFHAVLDAIKSYLAAYPDSMVGYVEAEYIPEEIIISTQIFDPNVPLPFTLELRDLPSGQFRADEIHITLDRDKSDPRLLLSLRQMGFFSVYMAKEWGMAEIFTTQGSFHDVNQVVMPALLEYLNKVGGAVNCVVKEERMIHYWLSHPDVKRPPVIGKIHLSGNAVDLSNLSPSLV